jgi:hypothetical protein
MNVRSNMSKNTKRFYRKLLTPLFGKAKLLEMRIKEVSEVYFIIAIHTMSRPTYATCGRLLLYALYNRLPVLIDSPSQLMDNLGNALLSFQLIAFFPPGDSLIDH